MRSSGRGIAAVGAGVLAASLLVTTVPPAPAAQAAAVPVTIAPNPAYASEPFEGWGTSLVWFANATGGYPDAVRQELLDKVFGADGLNLNIARYNIGGGNASDVPSYLRPGGAVQGWWNPDLGLADAQGVITSSYADRARYKAAWNGDDPAAYALDADATQRWWIDALKHRITRWEAFSNSPPYFLTQSGYASGGIGSGSTEQLAESDMAAFADYLVTVVQHLESAHGIAFGSLDPFNEPNTSYWSTTLGNDGWPTSASRQEGAHIGPARQDAMIKALAARLAEPGTTTRVPISAMDETNPSTFVTDWNGWSTRARSQVSQLNVHTYGTSDRMVVRDIAKSAGKPLWMSEVEGDWSGTGFDQGNIDNGLGMAGRMVDDLRELEPRAWVFWQPVEDAYNMQKVENKNWGSVYVDFDCTAEGTSLRRIAAGEADPSCRVTTNAKFNTVRNFTHYIRPGDVLVPSGDDRTTAAIPASGDGLTLVHVNTDSAAHDVTIDLSRFGALAPGATVTPIVTTQSSSAAPTENALVAGAPVTVDTVAKSARIAVPAKSVTTLLVTGVSGSSADAPALRDGRTYQLLGVQSGRALAAEGDGILLRTGATATSAAAAQTWTVRSISGEGTDRHRFALQAGDGRFLGESGGGTALVAATAAQAADDPSLQWISSTADGRTFSILSVSAQRVLDVNGQSTADGARVGLWTSNNGANQRWTLAGTRLESVRPVTATTVTGTPASLPAEVRLVYGGGVERTAAVSWDVAGADWSAAGTKTITGSGTDLFGTAFQATATVEIGSLATTDPVSLTTYAGAGLGRIRAAAPATVPAAIGASGATTAVPVTWDWTGIGDAAFAGPGIVTVPGSATAADGSVFPARLSVIVTVPTTANVAPASTASASFTESASYGVDRTKNGVTNDKGWSNWRSGTKNAQDTLTYALAQQERMQSAKLYFYKDGTSNSWPQSLSVEYRVGTGAWTSAGSVDVPVPADGTAPVVEVPLGGVPADAVRVIMNARPATHMIVSEVELSASAPGVSAVADLAAVTLDGAALPGFASDTTSYTVPWRASALPAVRAVPTDNAAKTAIVQPAAGNDRTASIVVTAPSGATRTYTIAFPEQTGPRLDATVEPSGRCVAGKAQLVLTVANTGDAAEDITVSTAYGTKAFAALAPGARASAALTTRLAAYPAGALRVVVAAADGSASRELQVSQPAGGCAG